MIKSKRRKLQFFAQHDATDCGTTCLFMISRYYALNISRIDITDKCGVSSNGVSLSTLKHVAEQIGLKATGYGFSIESLIEHFDSPAILHWNTNHYVILERITKASFLSTKHIFHIIDPLFGRVKFTCDEISNHWANTIRDGQRVGIALFIEYNQEIINKNNIVEEDSYKGLKTLYSYFSMYRNSYTKLWLSTILVILFQTALPFLTQSIVDIGVNDRDISFIYIILIAQAILLISRTIVSFIRSWLLLHISVRVKLILISGFINKLIKLPISFFESKKSGDLLQRIADHEKIESFITSKSIEILFSIFTLIIFSTILLYYNTSIYFIFSLLTISHLLWTTLFLYKRRVLNYKFFNNRSKNQSNIQQLILGIQEIKLQNCADRKQVEWEDIQVEMVDLHTESLKLEQFSNAGGLILNEGKNLIITVVAATSVVNGEMSIGVMLAIQYILGQLSLPIEELIQLIFSMQDMSISMDRVNEIYSRDDENRETHLIPRDSKMGDIIIKNLSFSYNQVSKSDVLKDISFVIPKGKITAIVGSSGSGKSTLLKLLLKYYVPKAGSIEVCENNLSDIDPIWWREQCGVVMQNGYIFTDTIARNIATSDKVIDYNKLNLAMKYSQIYDTVMELPLGYETVIGDEGEGLSQGQKQRLLIARAIYKDSPYLFLDEATNSLDANNEKYIVQKLDELFKDKTVLIIAHRLSTIQKADNIIVLENGIVVESGNHSLLMNERKWYYSLVKNQLTSTY
ncbi:MAG: peptidase domain-containing ABC transporter [Bacteroidales bacterium]